MSSKIAPPAPQSKSAAQDQPKQSDPTQPADPEQSASNEQPAGATPQSSIFADASKFQLGQGFELGVKRVYGASCRKPPRQEFVRTHKDPMMTMPAAIISLKDEMGENFLVMPELLSEMQGEIRPTLLVTSITRGGDLFFWPIPIPSDSNRSSRRWSQSALDAAEAAKSAWIRVYANNGQGQYEWMIASDSSSIGEPAWPADLTKSRMLELCFGGGNLITSLSHPVVKKLRGQL